MAHTNETSNYGLTQFIGSDKPAWLVDYNGDMLAIDTAMKAISDVADAAKSKADTNESNITTATTTANSASAKASGAISDISDEYDPTSTYDLGDLVIYNNLLYKCTTAITVPEAFDGTHWTRTTIEELMDTINSNLSELTDMNTVVTTLSDNDATYIGPYNVPCFLTIYGSKSSASSNASHCEHYTESGTYTDLVLQNPSETGVFNISFMLAKGDHVTLTIYNTNAKAIITKK